LEKCSASIFKVRYVGAMEEICGKTMAEMGRQHQEGLFVAVEYKRMKEASRGQGYLEANY
jgi:hypothetical protein